jgi:hypothetical protein
MWCQCTAVGTQWPETLVVHGNRGSNPHILIASKYSLAFLSGLFSTKMPHLASKTPPPISSLISIEYFNILEVPRLNLTGARQR